MEGDARRISDELRHKHIRTLEVLRQLTDENNAMRKKLKGTSNKQHVANRHSERELEPQEEPLPECQISKELKGAIEASEKANLEVSRVTAELDQAQTEANRARAAEEANELTLVVILARNKELEEARDAAEKRCQEQVERFETDIAELKGKLASTIAEARETEARAKLDVSRLESEVEELRHSANQAALSLVGTAWSDDGDDESVLSQREVENLQLCLRKASRRESTAKRRCIEFERQAKSEALRRGVAERELQVLQAAKPATSSPAVGRGPHFERLPPPSAPHRHGRLNGADITRKGRGGAPIALVKRPPEAAAAGPAVDPLPAVAALPLSSCPGSNAGDDGSTAPLAAAAPPSSKNGKKKAGGGGDDEGKLGSGIRRLRESEKILRESNAKLQRELKQSAKRLEKAEGFASNLEAELHRAAGDGVSFEMFVVLKRDNQALKTQLAEIKQAYSMVLASSPSKKVNISFSDSSLMIRDPISISRGTGVSLSRRGSCGAKEDGGGGGGKFIGQRPPSARTLSPSDVVLPPHRGSQHCRPSLTSPTQQRVRSLSSASSLTRGRTAPLRAVCHYKRAASTGAVCREQ